MPNRLVHVLSCAFGALALAACGLIGEENKAAEVMPRPTISLTADGPGGCTILLNGAPVTETALRDDLIMRMASYQRAMDGYMVHTGIPAPYPKIDAPTDMRFACVARILAPIADAEMPVFEFSRAGVGSRVEVGVLGTVSSAIDVIAVAANGGMTFNGEPIDAAALRQRVASVGTARIVAPAPDATVGKVYEVLFLLSTSNTSRPALALPGAIPSSPGAPMQDANAAAPR